MEPTHFESLYPDSSREKEIAQIAEYVKTGASAQITGLPGVGRSNILELLSYNRSVRTKHLGDNQKWFHFVRLNCAEIKNLPLQDVTKFIFLSLADSLRDRGLQEEHDKLHEIFKDHATFNDELVLFQGLKEALDLLTLEKELTIVFMFDRFEEYIPSLTPQFFSHLRVLRDRAKYRFSALFSTPRPLEDLVDQNILSEFYEFLAGHIVYLSIFDKPSIEFRISYLEKTSNKTLAKKTLETICSITGGHGKLTRIAIEEVVSQNVILNEVKNLGPFLLERKTIQRTLFEIWNFLTPAEQNILSQYVILSASEESRNQDTSVAILPQDDKAFLEKAGLLHNNTLTIPLFAEFIRTNSLITESQKETIEFNSTSNTITKGHLVLSENLTSSEFKLLKYLLQNPEKVLEREEVISAVWGDAKSTAGVTDQAVDQLIFRLRKKIEEDPNNPTHLQTIKGRGFKFSA